MAYRTIEIFVTGWLVSFREFMPPYKLDVCGCPFWTFLYVCVYLIVSVLVFVYLSGEIRLVDFILAVYSNENLLYMPIQVQYFAKF